jgi:hypothetical protein
MKCASPSILPNLVQFNIARLYPSETTVQGEEKPPTEEELFAKLPKKNHRRRT